MAMVLEKNQHNLLDTHRKNWCMQTTLLKLRAQLLYEKKNIFSWEISSYYSFCLFTWNCTECETGCSKTGNNIATTSFKHWNYVLKCYSIDCFIRNVVTYQRSKVMHSLDLHMSIELTLRKLISQLWNSLLLYFESIIPGIKIDLVYRRVFGNRNAVRYLFTFIDQKGKTIFGFVW